MPTQTARRALEPNEMIMDEQLADVELQSLRPQYNPNDLLNDEDLAGFLLVTAQHVRCSRMKKPTWKGPPHIEISPKVKRYLFSDVLRWVKEKRKCPADRAA